MRTYSLKAEQKRIRGIESELNRQLVKIGVNGFRAGMSIHRMLTTTESINVFIRRGYYTAARRADANAKRRALHKAACVKGKTK